MSNKKETQRKRWNLECFHNRLGVLIIPTGLLVIILLVFCVLFRDYGFFAFYEYIQSVLKSGGFIIIMLVNILWISNAFTSIHNLMQNPFFSKDKIIGIKHPLLMSLSDKLGVHDYSLIFYELTVRFLVLVGLEISVCFIFFSDQLSEILALTLPMVTIFIVCSCFIASRNENAEQQFEQDLVKTKIAIKLQSAKFPLLIYDRNLGKIGVSSVIKKLRVDDNTFARLNKLMVSNDIVDITLVPTMESKKPYDMFIVPQDQSSKWINDIKDSDKANVVLIYCYNSILQNTESEVTLVLNINLDTNQFEII